MVELQPFPLTNLCYTAEDFRTLLSESVNRDGVGYRTYLAVTTGGSGLNLSVAEGGAFVSRDNAPNRITYAVWNSGTTTITATAANPTNPRIDSVFAVIRDSDFGGTDDDWKLLIVPGIPTPGATLANLSGAQPYAGDALLLAHVLVPAGFTGPFVNATHILDERKPYVTGADSEVRSTVFTRSTNQSLTTGTITTVTFPAGATGTAVGDDWITESAGTVTVKRDGVYRVSGSLAWDPNADSNLRAIGLTIAGSSIIQQGPALSSASLTTNQTISREVSLLAGDTIVLTGRQASGGNLNVQSARLTVTRVGTLVA
jgi:hypothetical protein